jgi:hypothetical protein
MTRFWEMVSWLFIGLGVFLLAGSVLLVPANPAFADDGGPGGGGNVAPCTPGTTCPPKGDPTFCGVDPEHPSVCKIAGIPCTTQPVGVCDGCGCKFTDDNMNCNCH